MPTKHIVKVYDAPAFYHVYNRASGERPLFRDNRDRLYFLALLQKHLAGADQEDGDITRVYDLEIVAYCLMGTHFHLLLFQENDPAAISGFMRSVSTSYSMYYNKKYKSKGHVFQSSYRASPVTNESYLEHITRYIHLNPRYFETWKWSSYQEYIGRRSSDWIRLERVLDNPQARDRYANFVKDYASVDRREQYSELKDQLAF